MNKPAENTAFNETTNNYQAGTFIVVEKSCFAYSATNIGDTIVEVNGHRLFPSPTPLTAVGDAVSISAPDGQVYKGQIKVAFIAPIGVAPNVEISQLFYLDQNQYTL
jgi:hypothetical protein